MPKSEFGLERQKGYIWSTWTGISTQAAPFHLKATICATSTPVRASGGTCTDSVLCALRGPVRAPEGYGIQTTAAAERVQAEICLPVSTTGSTSRAATGICACASAGATSSTRASNLRMDLSFVADFMEPGRPA